MINLNDYPKVKADLNSKTTNLHYLMIIGWNRFSDFTTPIGSPYNNSIYISQNSERIDGNYYADYDLNIPIITESQSITKNKHKISNLNVKVTNYDKNGKVFSNEYDVFSLTNKDVVIFLKSQSCNSLSECLPVFLGVIRESAQNTKNVTFNIEDYSEQYLDVFVPLKKLGTGINVPQTQWNKSVPMNYGRLDKVLVPHTVSEGTEDNFVRLKLNLDSAPIENYEHCIAISDREFTFGDAQDQMTLLDGPVYIYKGEQYLTVSRKAEISFNPIIYTNYQIGNLQGNDPSINFISITDSDSEIETQGQYLNDTANHKLRIKAILYPNKIEKSSLLPL